MNKELLITLIKKDVKELEILTGSFEQMQEIPMLLLNLALDKTRALSANLSALGNSVPKSNATVQKENLESVNNVSVETGITISDEFIKNGEQALVDEAALYAQSVVEADEKESNCADELIEIAPELIELDADSEEEVSENEKDMIAEESVPEMDIQDTDDATESWNKEKEAVVTEASLPTSVEDKPLEMPLKPEVHVGPELNEEDEDDADIAESMMEEVEEEAEVNPEEDLVLESPSELYVSAPDMELKEAADLAHAINEPIKLKSELKAESDIETDKEEENKITNSVSADGGVTRLADTINKSESVAQSLSSGDDTTVGNSMRMQPISDLKSAITIVDRFRFQRELFGGDGEKMMKTIADLNELNSMSEAQSYIEKHFHWSEENSTVADFMNLLSRRFQ